MHLFKGECSDLSCIKAKTFLGDRRVWWLHKDMFTSSLSAIGSQDRCQHVRGGLADILVYIVIIISPPHPPPPVIFKFMILQSVYKEALVFVLCVR